MGNECGGEKNTPTTDIAPIIDRRKPIYMPVVQKQQPKTIEQQPRLQNPNPQEVQQDVTRDFYYQSVLKNKGINQDYIVHPEYYLTCLSCQGQYGQNLKPVKLDCGHLICQSCRNMYQQCLVYNCKKGVSATQTKENVFNQVQILTQKKNSNKDRQYNVTLKISQDSHTETIEKKVKGTQRLSQIIEANIKIRNIFKQNPNGLLQIKSSPGQYNAIKNMTFGELAEKFNLLPKQSGKDNIITYYSAQKGGQICNNDSIVS